MDLEQAGIKRKDTSVAQNGCLHCSMRTFAILDGFGLHQEGLGTREERALKTLHCHVIIYVILKKKKIVRSSQ